MAGIKFVHTEETEVKLNGIPKVPFNKSKKLSSMMMEKHYTILIQNLHLE